MVHQILTTSKPSFLYAKIHNPVKSGTRASKNGDLILPKYKKNLSRLSFAFRGVSGYNSIKKTMKDIKKKQIFKNKIKSMIKNQRSHYTKCQLVTPEKFNEDGPSCSCSPLSQPTHSPTCAAVKQVIVFTHTPTGSLDPGPD